MDILGERDRFSNPIPTTESSATAPSQTDVSGIFDRRSSIDREDSLCSSHRSKMIDGSHETASSRKRKLQQLAGKTIKVTKRIFSPSERKNKQQALLQDNEQVTSALRDDAAFNLKQLSTERKSEKTLAAKVQINLQAVAGGIIHPKQGIKGKAARSTAGRLSKVERPYASKGLDIEYLEAHDNLSRTQSSASSGRNTSEDNTDLSSDGWRKRVEHLEVHRESLRVAYATSRFVRRVRVVAKRHIESPRIENLTRTSNTKDSGRTDWQEWLGHILLYYTQDFAAQYIDDFDELPFNTESLQLHTERLITASAPWQEFFMSVRSVYRWESPLHTAKWFAVYVLLWYTQNLMSFVYGYIVYAVVRKRWFPSSVESLRESMRRAHDQGRSAYNFGELVDKHGRNHWLEPLLDDLGPFIQVQTNDIANMLEVFANFHGWVNPQKTAATLFFLVLCLLICLLTDMAFCMKVTTFISGGTFFVCWPISSHYPKYRYLVSPFKWAMWDVPTDAEWSFQYLRRNAQITREKLIERATDRNYHDETDGHVFPGTSRVQAVPDIVVDATGLDDDDDDEDWHSTSSATSVLDGSDLVAYRAYSHGTVGQLIIYAGGVRFVRSIKRRELWRRSFLELTEMRKNEGSSVSKLPAVPSHSLELKCIDGSRLVLDGINERDSAFNTIIGFSGLQWQSLQAKIVNNSG
ncbi:MAG: hypothetical protein Q9181_000409 [Wetmoreana brouardii]